MLKWYLRARLQRLLWQGFRSLGESKNPSLHWPYWKRASIPRVVKLEIERQLFKRLFRYF